MRVKPIAEDRSQTDLRNFLLKQLDKHEMLIDDI